MSPLLKRPHRLCAGLAPLLLATGTFALPQVAHAAGYQIYSPYVEFGENEIEARSYVNQDGNPAIDGTGALKISIGRGMTQFWATEFYFAKLERDASGNTHPDAIEWENRFQLTPQGKYWADFGLLVETEVPAQASHPYEFKVGPLIAKSFGRTVATVNLFFEREFGPHADSETEFSYAANLRYRLNPHFEPAIEVYGSPGDIGEFEPKAEQRHQIGPGFYGEFRLADNSPSKIKYSAAALHGITGTGSPDWTFVLRLEYEFF